jgi:hypothetical protein
MRKSPFETTVGVAGIALFSLMLVVIGGIAEQPESAVDAEARVRVLVQGADAAVVAREVEALGGSITHELDIIDAVAAELTPRALAYG